PSAKPAVVPSIVRPAYVVPASQTTKPAAGDSESFEAFTHPEIVTVFVLKLRGGMATLEPLPSTVTELLPASKPGYVPGRGPAAPGVGPAEYAPVVPAVPTSLVAGGSPGSFNRK